MKRWAILLLALALLAAASAALGAGPRGSRGNPYPIRTTVRLPAGQGWKLRVNKSIPNATRLVLDWNRFNTPPKGGHQFFIINITLAYSGKGSASPFAPTHLFAVGRSKVEYSMVDDSCGGSVRAAELRHEGGRRRTHHRECLFLGMEDRCAQPAAHLRDVPPYG